MKSTTRLVLLTVIMATVFGWMSLRADSMTISFPTTGNCYLCQVRIEAAVNALEGIEEVHWDYLTDVTTVTYNDGQTDAFIIMDAIANVGHDTEWFPAPDSAYNLLIGTCCEYDRVIDYSEVQVGYLSLMDIWVYHVSVPEVDKDVSFNIFPTAGTGLYTYTLNTKSTLQDCTFTVISLSGKEVFRGQADNSQKGDLDLTHLTRGQYILIVSDSRKALAWAKLIKI